MKEFFSKPLVKKAAVAIWLAILTRIPYTVEWELWLSEAGTPVYFYAIRYALECIAWMLFFLYIAWWVLSTLKKE